MLRLLHHLHDAGIAGIRRDFCSPDGQKRFTVESAGKNCSSGSLFDLKGFAREVRFIHRSLTFQDYSVHRADFVRKNNQQVTHGNFERWNIDQDLISFSMSDDRHAFGKRVQDARGAPRREFLESGAAGKHQYDNRGNQVLPQQYRGDDGNPREEVGTELPGPQFPG